MTHAYRPDVGSPLLTTEEVIDYLRVNARTVYRLIRSGDLPAVRIGHQWRIRRKDLERWLDGGGASHPPA